MLFSVKLCVLVLLCGSRCSSLARLTKKYFQSGKAFINSHYFFAANVEWLTHVFALGATQGGLRLSTTPQAHAQLFLCALEGAMVVGRGGTPTMGPAMAGESLISLMLA